MNVRTLIGAGLLSASLMVTPGLLAQAQNGHSALQPESAEHKTAGPQTWTTEQLMTATVHQAWLMSGKNEATFFEMVTQLAEISAKNRDVKLPQTEEAGEKFGQLIKTQARKDTDQLLYSIVDDAVKQMGKPAA